MTRLRRLLIAIDNTSETHHALTLGLALSRGYGSELHLCTVVDHATLIAETSSPDALYPNLADVLQQVDAAADSFLSDAAARANAAGALATTKLLDGRPAAALVAYAKENALDAIVMGTQGKGGIERALLGSTAQGVLQLTDLPVFLIRAASDAASTEIPLATPFARILVAIDDSEPADAALALATELGERASATLVGCNVIETADLYAKASGYGYDPAPMLAEMGETANALLATKLAPARERGLRIESIVAQGTPAEALLVAAATNSATLIAIGTHGRRGLKRLFLGSVAERLVRNCDVPVVVVRR